MKTLYTLAFLFSTTWDGVLLIEKAKKPVQHIGKYNGIGGKVEEGETYSRAIVREIKEESGLDVANVDSFATIGGADWTCECFKGVAEFNRGLMYAGDEGRVLGIAIDEILKIPTVSNVPWLIFMAIDNDPSLMNPKIHYR